MKELIPILLGIVAGGVCALPALHMLRAAWRGERLPGLAALAACAAFPFLLLQALLVVAVLLWRPQAPAFGTAAVLSFLALISGAGLRAWTVFRH